MRKKRERGGKGETPVPTKGKVFYFGVSSGLGLFLLRSCSIKLEVAYCKATTRRGQSNRFSASLNFFKFSFSFSCETDDGILDSGEKARFATIEVMSVMEMRINEEQ